MLRSGWCAFASWSPLAFGKCGIQQAQQKKFWIKIDNNVAAPPAYMLPGRDATRAALRVTPLWGRAVGGLRQLRAAGGPGKSTSPAFTRPETTAQLTLKLVAFDPTDNVLESSSPENWPSGAQLLCIRWRRRATKCAWHLRTEGQLSHQEAALRAREGPDAAHGWRRWRTVTHEGSCARRDTGVLPCGHSANAPAVPRLARSSRLEAAMIPLCWAPGAHRRSHACHPQTHSPARTHAHWNRA